MSDPTQPEPNCYHLEFTAPSLSSQKGEPEPANWGAVAAQYPVPRDPNTGRPDAVTIDPMTKTFVPDKGAVVAVVEVEEGNPTTIVITGGNWPKTCTRALQLELEWDFNPIRDDLGLLYVLPLKDKNTAASRRVTITFTYAGLLTIASYLTVVSFDLNAMSSENERHSHRIVILPRTIRDEKGQLIRKSKALLTLDGKRIEV